MADEEIVADEGSGLSEYAAGGEEGADEASPPAGAALPGDATGIDAAAPIGEEAGSEEESAPAPEVESEVPADVGTGSDAGMAAVTAPGLDVSVAAAVSLVVPVVSAVPTAATGLPVRVVAEAGAVPGVDGSDSDTGDATIASPAAPAPPVLARLSLARASRECCKLLPAAPLGLFFGWPSAVAVRAQCVASAL